MPDDPSLALLAEVKSLFERWGETAVISAVEAARPRKPRGPKPMADYRHLLNTMGIMLLHAFGGKTIQADEALLIYVDSLRLIRPKERAAMLKRLRRKILQNWMGVLALIFILYEMCVTQEVTEGHKRWLLAISANWWTLRKLSSDPGEIAKFWEPDGSGRSSKWRSLGPIGQRRFAVYDL